MAQLKSTTYLDLGPISSGQWFWNRIHFGTENGFFIVIISFTKAIFGSKMNSVSKSLTRWNGYKKTVPVTKPVPPIPCRSGLTPSVHLVEFVWRCHIIATSQGVSTVTSTPTAPVSQLKAGKQKRKMVQIWFFWYSVKKILLSIGQFSLEIIVSVIWHQSEFWFSQLWYREGS